MNFNDWVVQADVEYELKTDEFKVGGTATYEFENVSVSFSGSQDSDDNAKSTGKVTFKF